MKKVIYVVFDKERSTTKAFTNREMAEKEAKEIDERIEMSGGYSSAVVKELELVEEN